MKPSKIKEKIYFDVRVETLLPATLKFRILAEDENEALQLIKGKAPNEVKYQLTGRRDWKATVLTAGSCMIKLIKNLR